MALGWTVIYFTAAVLGHLFLVRMPIGLDRVNKFVVVASGFGLGLCVQLYINASERVTAIASLVTYILACELYVFAFTLVSASISVRLLLVLQQKGMSEKELKDKSTPKDMVERRLARVMTIGLTEQREGRLRLTQRGRRLVAVFGWLQYVFNQR